MSGIAASKPQIYVRPLGAASIAPVSGTKQKNPPAEQCPRTNQQNFSKILEFLLDEEDQCDIVIVQYTFSQLLY